MKERFKIQSAAHLFVKNGNKILLHLRRKTDWFDGYYSDIGGHYKAGEFYSEYAFDDDLSPPSAPKLRKGQPCR